MTLPPLLAFLRPRRREDTSASREAAEQAHREVDESSRRHEVIREKVVLPLEGKAQRNQFADLILNTLVGGEPK